MGIMVSEVYEALIEAGASEAKAKAAAEAVPISEQVATKQDIAELKAEMMDRPAAVAEQEQTTRRRWMEAVLAGGIGALLALGAWRIVLAIMV